MFAPRLCPVSFGSAFLASRAAVRLLAAAAEAFFARGPLLGRHGLQRALAADLAALAPDLAHDLAEGGFVLRSK